MTDNPHPVAQQFVSRYASFLQKRLDDNARRVHLMGELTDKAAERCATPQFDYAWHYSMGLLRQFTAEGYMLQRDYSTALKYTAEAMEHHRDAWHLAMTGAPIDKSDAERRAKHAYDFLRNTAKSTIGMFETGSWPTTR